MLSSPVPRLVSDRATARAMLAGSAALTAAVLPVFLVGALSDAIRAELGIGEAAIGAAVTVQLLVAGLVASRAGRFAEHAGPVVALRSGVVVVAVATAVIAAFATSWWLLALPMAGAGVAVAMVDTGAARGYADAVPVTAHGLAFGVKEASVPAAALLAGLVLPTLGSQVGWRVGFAAAAAVIVLVWLVIPASFRAAEDVQDGDLLRDGHAIAASSPGAVAAPSDVVEVAAATDQVPRPQVSTGVRWFALAAGIGTAAATAAGTFLAPAVTARGGSPSVAGAVLVAASIASISVRVLAGRWADRDVRPPATVVGAMLLVGACGAGLLALDLPTAGVVLAAMVLLGAGWGWTGLAFLAAVRATPDAPAAAAGVILAGLGGGGAVGPLVFGAVADQASYGLAWVVAGLAMGVGGVLALAARARLDPTT